MEVEHINLYRLGNAGVPDRLVVLPNGKIGFAELKRPGGKTTDLQDIQINRLKNLGCFVMIVDSVDKIDEFIEGLIKQ